MTLPEFSGTLSQFWPFAAPQRQAFHQESLIAKLAGATSVASN